MISTWIVCCAFVVAVSDSNKAELPKAEPKFSLEQVACHTEHTKARERYGLLGQRLSPDLCRRAQAWAEEMAAREQMAHSPPSWRRGVSENVAYSQPSAEAVISVWMNSRGHRANLLSSDPCVGFGFARSRTGTPYWCSMHGDDR